MPSFEASTLGELLQHRARQCPNKVAYIYLGDGESEYARLTYRELDRSARSVAAAIRSRDATGLRVLLLFAPGIDFVTALFGCFYADAVAVPAYPPDPTRLDRTLPRFMAIIKDSTPALVLTTSDLMQMTAPLRASAPQLAGLEWIAVDALPVAAPGNVDVDPDNLAFIQYTSGSTATPKGVMVSHHNALASLRMITERSKQEEDGVLACWVPFYHDMGLLCGIMVPMFIRGSGVFMSPLDFFQRPARWFEAIQNYRATGTCAPNFALDLCVNRIRPEERKSLDLSSLKALVFSSEPVRSASLQRFTKVFAPSGLSPTCITAAYGLAEAVLALTCASPDKNLPLATIDADELQRNRWREVAPNHPRARALISCGPPLRDVRIEIVDPERCTRCAPGEIGEIWALAPSVALGYWNRSIETREVFGARLEDTGDGPFLRTGDMGYIKDGELYVTGRIKDLIIIRGKNHYPQDIESTVEGAHPAVRAGCVIAFSIDTSGIEQLVIVAEIDRSRLGGGQDEASALEQVVHAIRLHVSAEHGVQVHDVALIKSRTIDKTSSGKLARRACRQRYLEGRLDTELPCRSAAAPSADAPSAPPSSPVSVPEPPSVSSFGGDLWQMAPERRRELLTAYVERQLVSTTGADAERVVKSGGTVALDSLAVLELTGRVDKDFGIKLPMARLHEGVSVAWLVDYLLENRAAQVATDRTRAAGKGRHRGRLTIPLQPAMIRRPFFCISGALGMALHLKSFAEAIGRDQPFYALQAPGIDGHERVLRTVEALAQRYLEEIRHAQPRGPYAIGGYSFGGFVAYEIAQRLTALGEEVSRLLLLDTIMIAPDNRPPARVSPHAEAYELLHFLRGGQRAVQPGSGEDLSRLSAAELREILLSELATTGNPAPEPILDRLIEVHRANMQAMRCYRPRVYQGPTALVRAERGLPDGVVHPSRELRMQVDDPMLGWGPLCPRLRVVSVGGDHVSLMKPPDVLEVAAVVRSELEGCGHIEISLPPVTTAEVAAPRRIEPASSDSKADAPLLFNPFHPDFIADPYPTLHRLRAEDPVHWSVMSLWFISRFKDVVTGLRDKRFSADSRRRTDRTRRSLDGPQGRISMSALSGWSRDDNSPQARVYNNIMMTLDPPRHTRLRRLVSPVFEPSAMLRWRGYVQEIVDSLLMKAGSQSDVDLIRDLALPLPTMVICTLLGLPREDVPMLRQWSFDMTQALDPLITRDVFERAGRVAEEFDAYLRRHVERSQGAPKGDLLALMLSAEADGDRLTMDELIANCILFFIAGFESTTGAIGNSILALLRNPEQMQLLRERPELIDDAVEELLRYDGSVPYVFRTAVEDVEMGGKLIRGGDYVLFMLGAANRDPEEFPDPDRLDLTRKMRHHITFGYGIHYCLGAPLSRLEIKVAIQTIIRTWPGMKLIPDGLRWRNSIWLRALESFRITPA